MRELLWRKTLTKTDAQKQLGNPTGDLRLTRAKFLVNGNSIDQTQYFRHTVFQSENWIEKEGKHPKEICTAIFQIFIDGELLGEDSLEIQHKPSGEANQSNYTTGIRWGPWLSHILINEVNCTGKNLSLYKDEKYVIEID
tara:strand:- start:6424 stop:6843 length:420 start_codon:yes stop_codon:yes gene_type:complete